jgi:hypothetical protein
MRELRLIGSALLVAALAAPIASSAAREHNPFAHRSPHAGACSGSAAFVRNLGQWDARLQFVAVDRTQQIGLEADGLVFCHATSECSASVVRLGFEHAAPSVTIESEDERLGVYNYFLGDDPAKWVHCAPSYGLIRYQGVWPGVDIELRHDGATLEYDVTVAPGADMSHIVFSCEGAVLTQDSAGRLALACEGTTLWQAPGCSWQVHADGSRVAIEVTPRLIDPHHFGFVSTARDASLNLVIDPRLAWSTYLGSAPPVTTGFNDEADGVATGRNGDVTVVGRVSWINFPTTPGSYQHPGGRSGPTFVTKLRGSDGALLYSSLIGGLGVNGFTFNETATSVAIDAQGRSVVAGWTFSRNFPTTPGAFDTHFHSFNRAGYVLRLSEIGELEFSTFLQANNDFPPTAIAVDERTGSIVVAGSSCCGGLPVTPGAIQTHGDPNATDGYVARLDSTGSRLEYGSYIGGRGADQINALAVDARGRIAVTGQTNSLEFPTTPGAYRTMPGASPAPGIGNTEVFVSVFATSSDHLEWSTYFGATGATESTNAWGIAFDPEGGVIITGVGGGSPMSTFPTTPGAWQTQPGGAGDAYLTRFTPDGSALVYSTLFGGAQFQSAFALSVDHSGVATIVGDTFDLLPTTPGAFDVTFNGGLGDAFVARFNPTGSRLLYSSYLGASDEDHAKCVSLSPTGRATVVGYTYSVNWPTTPNALGPNYVGGLTDAFATSLDLLLKGVTLLGDSTPGCHGPLTLNALKVPSAGEPHFGFYLSGAPPFSDGVLMVGAPGAGATPQQGIDLWLDPNQPITETPFSTDADGYAEIFYSLASLSAGAQFAAQAVVAGTSDCGGTNHPSASNAVVIQVQ